MIDKTYRCNLCRDTHHPDRLIGLYWDGAGWIKKPARNVENHICSNCLMRLHQIEEES